MTTIRFLNGLNTIGGNIVEFATKTSRVIMDFGVAADLSQETVTSAIDQGKLPNVPELFLDQPDPFTDEAIFISHLHIDHMGALQYLQKDIPIYLSEPSYRLYRLLIQLGIEKPVANLHPLAFETPLAVGDLTVTGFHSDHDEPGVMALLVDDGSRRFAHSGDVRLNGPHADRVHAWAKRFKEEKVSLLMLEGTSFSFDTPIPVEDQDHPSVPLTEMSLQTKFQQLLVDSSQLVVINPYNRNYERLAAFQASAHVSGRQMVWEPNEAAILATMTGTQPDAILGQTIQLADIAQQPQHYVLQNSFANLASLSGLPISAYVHSNGEPLGDYDPRFAQLKDWLADHQIPLVFMNASGHAAREDLIELVKEVNPRVVVPWHSFHPEREADAIDAQTNADVLLPEKDLYYDFDPLTEEE
ncbi:MBL fold metallo-hydrolase [Lacticaseibacillus chiayiensis]|uniref:MBL fold metallo-hydrolase n=1 Tax=Lacticaseibacillus chiayiensis TaxID=2100821 RepID=UPI0010103DF6|nr:MBL fold metallo-hydrolase [Lacticaseibacillus chiayiensis]RXT59455.1 MBL fold hydrolase [Lacticaseibacillus chiayiensis]